MGGLSLELILGCLAAGAAGMMVGKQTPALSLRLIGYKESKKGKRYKPYVFPRWRSWLYGAGLAVAWAMAAYYYTSAYMVIVAALALVALVIVYVDNRYRIIANEITVPLMVFGLFFNLLQGGIKGVAGSLLAAVLGTLLCAAAAVLTRKNQAVGAGDVKLMMAAAMVTGFYGFVYMMFFMAVTMGIYCVGGLLLKKFTLQSYFPMGGFIALGMVLAFFEEQLMPILHLLIG